MFLTCFLACMFAFVVFGVIAWQVGAFLIRRSITQTLPTLVAQAIHGTPDCPGMTQDQHDRIKAILNEVRPA